MPEESPEPVRATSTQKRYAKWLIQSDWIPFPDGAPFQGVKAGRVRTWKGEGAIFAEVAKEGEQQLAIANGTLKGEAPPADWPGERALKVWKARK